MCSLETSNRRRSRPDFDLRHKKKKKFIHYCLHMHMLLVFILSGINQVHNYLNYLFKIHFNIIPTMPGCSKLPFSARFAYHNPICIPPYMLPLRLRHPTWSVHPNIRREVKQIHLFVTKFSSVSYHLVPPRSKCLPQYYLLEDHQCAHVRLSAFRMILNFYSEDVFALCTTLSNVDYPLSAIPNFLTFWRLTTTIVVVPYR